MVWLIGTALICLFMLHLQHVRISYSIINQLNFKCQIYHFRNFRVLKMCLVFKNYLWKERKRKKKLARHELKFCFSTCRKSENSRSILFSFYNSDNLLNYVYVPHGQNLYNNVHLFVSLFCLYMILG